MSPAKPKKPPEPLKTEDAEAVKSQINNVRRRSPGSYSQTILASGLKTALGQ